MRRLALLSVFDKRGILDIARAAREAGLTVVTTDGTGVELLRAGFETVPAGSVSLNPKGLDGCIKTISFRIEAGILFDRTDPVHLRQTAALQVDPIDLVVCNFPPLEQVVTRVEEFGIRNIDIGGPLMVRAAATNLRHVLVVVDPADYAEVAEELMRRSISTRLRQHLARKAFTYTSSYDRAIYEYLERYQVCAVPAP